jgi:hypothetical protein
MKTYPARCPRCGAPATNALFSDPSVPIYGCGSWGTARPPRCVPVAGLPGSPNVQRVDSADMRELLDMVDLASVAVMRAAG